MDRKKTFKWIGIVVGVAAPIGALFHPTVRHALHPPGLIKSYVEAFRSVSDKVDDLRRAYEENERLRIENANLRIKLDGAQFDASAQAAQVITKDFSLKLTDEKGEQRLKRAIANTQYRAPDHLMPEQLYTLAVGYFKREEDEKAAVIMSQLTQLEDVEDYKNARDLLMTGIAWFRAGNYEVAEIYFQRAVDAKGAITPDEQMQFSAQARLWRALSASKLKQHERSQKLLVELVDHHPQSREAGWVNRAIKTDVSHAEEGHKPASVPSSEPAAVEDHGHH